MWSTNVSHPSAWWVPADAPQALHSERPPTDSVPGTEEESENRCVLYIFPCLSSILFNPALYLGKWPKWMASTDYLCLTTSVDIQLLYVFTSRVSTDRGDWGYGFCSIGCPLCLPVLGDWLCYSIAIHRSSQQPSPLKYTLWVPVPLFIYIYIRLF